MSLPRLPKAEIISPLLKVFLAKKYNLSFKEEAQVFSKKTEELLEDPLFSFGLIFLERYLLENFQKNLYSQELLKNLIEVKEMQGYIFRLKKLPPSFTFFQWEKYYFYPLFFGEIKELFKKLWRNKEKFCALFTVVKSSNELRELKDLLKIFQKLHFTRITPKAKENLEDLFELYLSRKGNKWERNLKKGNFLLVVTNHFNLEEEFQPILFYYKGKRISFYIFREEKLHFLEAFCQKSSFIYGLITSSLLREAPFSGINPFLLGIAVFEHAKRAGKTLHLLDGFTLHVLADLFYEWEDFGSALKFYELAKPYTLQPIELILSIASIYYALGDLDMAEAILKSKLCGCIKEDPQIHYNLGIIYQQKENFEGAEYHFYKAYLLEKENPLFRKTLLTFLWERERFEEMEDILSQVKDLTLEDKIYLGKLAFLKKNYQEALKLLQEINSYAERDGTALFFLAWLYLYFKKEREVAEIFLKEAKEKLSEGELNKLLETFGLPL